MTNKLESRSLQPVGPADLVSSSVLDTLKLVTGAGEYFKTCHYDAINIAFLIVDIEAVLHYFPLLFTVYL